MFVNPLKKDPGCVAKTAIATALVRLDCQEIELFREGVRYRQLEPAWKGPVDTAAALRAVCAAGLAGCATCMEALNTFAEMLVDDSNLARSGAVRAIASLGRWEGVPLLRLKLLCGDADAEVIGECCSALLHLAPEEGPGLVIQQLHSNNVDVRIQAALALGESHCEQSLQALCACFDSEPDSSVRSILLTSIGLLRSPESRLFLLQLVKGPDEQRALDAIRALAPFRMDEQVRRQVETAVEKSGNVQRCQMYAREFGEDDDP